VASLSSTMKSQSTTTEETHTIVPHYWLINQGCRINMPWLKRSRSGGNRPHRLRIKSIVATFYTIQFKQLKWNVTLSVVLLFIRYASQGFCS
jgi:hypothetical protein